MTKIYLILPFVFLTVACGTTDTPNKLTSDRNGNTVTGVAGSNWADNELSIACNPGETITNLSVQRDAAGVGTFSGDCVPAL